MFKPRECNPRVERCRDGARIRAIAHQRDLLDDIKQADCGHDGAFRVIVQPLEDCHIGGHRQCPHDQRRGNQRQCKADGGMPHHTLRDPPGQHRAQHEELAMRDIDHPHHAKHKAQPYGGQRQHRRRDRALERGQNQIGA
jgi:hypothetical protein